MRRANITFVGLVAMLCMASVSWGNTILYVDDDAPLGGDGLSWETAYKYLQDALATTRGEKVVLDDSCGPGPCDPRIEIIVVGEPPDGPCEVRVASGLYQPDRYFVKPDGSGDRASTFTVVETVTLKGGYAGLGATEPNACDPNLYQTILSGDLDGNDVPVSDPGDLLDAPDRHDNAFHVVQLSRGVVEGVTMTGGYAHLFLDRIPMVPYNPDHGGGGVWGEGTVRDCILYANFAEEAGGGVWCDGSLYDEIQKVLILQRCVLTGNATRAWGGGMFAVCSQVKLEGCEFNVNWAGTDGGGFMWYKSDVNAVDCVFSQNTSGISGGGINSYKGLSEFSECIISNNYTGSSGGGASAFGGISQFTECNFTNNSTSISGTGGAAAFNGEEIRFHSCFITGNQAGSYGGAVATKFSSVDFKRCTITDNQATQGSFLAIGTNSSWPRSETIHITGCIIKNQSPEIWNYDGMVYVNYSNIDIASYVSLGQENQLVPGLGNLDCDPLFVNPGYWDVNDTPDDPNDDFYVEGDYHLKSQAGHWDPNRLDDPNTPNDPNRGSWICDLVTSPCIDAGDPNDPVGDEPLPNGDRINMGAYGGTPEASKSYFDSLGSNESMIRDLGGNYRVDCLELACMACRWLE